MDPRQEINAKNSNTCLSKSSQLQWTSSSKTYPVSLFLEPDSQDTYLAGHFTLNLRELELKRKTKRKGRGAEGKQRAVVVYLLHWKTRTQVASLISAQIAGSVFGLHDRLAGSKISRSPLNCPFRSPSLIFHFIFFFSLPSTGTNISM